MERFLNRRFIAACFIVTAVMLALGGSLTISGISKASTHRARLLPTVLTSRSPDARKPTASEPTRDHLN
jgi:hypothetical protein